VSSGINLVFTLRAGKIARYQEFYSEQPALEAVGLAESEGSN
jgi:ketosteroid isomerase-like protein